MVLAAMWHHALLIAVLFFIWAVTVKQVFIAFFAPYWP